MPTPKQIEQAICCPKGCLRPEDCWSPMDRAVQSGAVDAIVALYKPPKVERQPTREQKQCLGLISLAGGSMSHDDKRLEPFCDDDDAPTDVFNQCHNAGWLTSRHDDRLDSSTVYLTQAGSDILIA